MVSDEFSGSDYVSDRLGPAHWMKRSKWEEGANALSTSRNWSRLSSFYTVCALLRGDVVILDLLSTRVE